MQPELGKYLYDVSQACEALLGFIQNKKLEDYKSNLLLRSGVERQIMIIGEAMNQAIKTAPELSAEIDNIRQIVNLRNVIVHGYATVENETIWGIIQDDVPKLHEQVKKLLTA